MINFIFPIDNRNNSLQRLNRLIVTCITGLITLCVIILAFAIQQSLTAREKRAEVLHLHNEIRRKDYNCRLIIEELNELKGAMHKLKLKQMESCPKIEQKAPKFVKAEHLFRIFDFDGDDMLGFFDLKQVIERLVADQNRLPERDITFLIKIILSEADLNDDGALSFPEFEHIIDKWSAITNSL